VAAAGAASLLPRISSGQEAAGDLSWRRRLIDYLETHARKDGGYGWEGQERSHLTPTFAVVGCYNLLGEKPPKAKEVAEFIRTHHPRALKGQLGQELRAFEWQQIQSLVWLDEDVSSFRDVVKNWKSPYAYPKQYERNGYPVFQQEVSAILSWKLLRLPVDEIPVAFVEYLNSRRRSNGSFNNTPSREGSDGHVLNTWWGLQALAALESDRQPVDWQKSTTAAWLRKCQLESGAFGYQPAAGPGDWDDLAYTWAGVRSLALLGFRVDAVEYVHSLWNEDGGFGDRPKWLSNPLATYYALDTLAALGSLATREPKAAATTRTRPRLPEDLKVFSIQIEAHGQGSPEEAVDLADSLKIHLWGAKNSKTGWIERAQHLANQQGADVRFFVASEEHVTWIGVAGMGIYSHMSDVVGPAAASLGSSLAGDRTTLWSDFRHQRLGDPSALWATAIQQNSTATRPPNIFPIVTAGRDAGTLVRSGGRLIWQFGENEPLVRMLLDDSIMRGGYSAISTYHFGNPDFTNTSPFLMRYRGQIPFVALQDAHGTEPWWFADMTAGFRTLFLATKPTWENWLTALKNNWVVAVRHDVVSSGETWMHGMPEVIEVVKDQWREWQWWDNPGIERPLVSIVALKPTSEFETGKPESGFAVRVRCAFTNTTQGLPKTRLSELMKLMVAGKQVEPEHVTKRRPNGAIEDDYYLYASPEAQPGRYTATATVRNVATEKETKRSIAFVV